MEDSVPAMIPGRFFASQPIMKYLFLVSILVLQVVNSNAQEVKAKTEQQKRITESIFKINDVAYWSCIHWLSYIQEMKGLRVFDPSNLSELVDFSNLPDIYPNPRTEPLKKEELGKMLLRFGVAGMNIGFSGKSSVSGTVSWPNDIRPPNYGSKVDRVCDAVYLRRALKEIPFDSFMDYIKNISPGSPYIIYQFNEHP